MQQALLNRFLRYVQINTQSNSHCLQSPSSDGQWQLAKLLQQELIELGFSDIRLTDNCCLYARVPATLKDVPTIGFIAHLDTAPDFSGANVKPQLVENYQGQILPLAGDEVLSPEQFPELLHYIGKTLVTTDGTTLLGADDKAGIAAIISALHHLIAHPDIPHGEVVLCFTPDEEIGRGAQHFDVDYFNADWAYTIDGGAVGELQYENFNAATAVISAKGNACHPGSAFGVLVNAMTMACRFHAKMPLNDTPEHSEGYDGFFHLGSMQGSTECAELVYIIRDFDADQFNQRKTWLTELVHRYNDELTAGSLTIEIKDSYLNMKQTIEPLPHIIDIATKAMEMADVHPDIKPIRGGTDGAQLSYRGLPCPNLFAGGHNFHGKHEFVCVESMLKATEVIINIAKLATQRYN